ncbi:MAG TPA: hypothetical protein VJU61_13260, partial [Polyangiaceae bacterium]|nr:hypothetical protein [Polyangiaceae bacterium]
MIGANPRTFTRGDEVELAHALLDAIGPHVAYAEGNFWTWSASSGAWEIRSAESLQALVAQYAGSVVLAGRAKLISLSHGRIAGTVRLARSVVISDKSRPEFPAVPSGIAFSNGFVRVAAGQIALLPHQAGNMARHAFGFPYVPGQPTPRLNDFFDEIFADTNERREQVALIQEFLGTCMIGQATSRQKCLVFLGT